MTKSFEKINTDFEGAYLIKPFYIEDNRGYFLKSFEKDVFNSFGLKSEIYEDFESLSTKDVIRGMHFQTKNPQIKFVRVIVGKIMDVIVDLRFNSKTFGQWKSFILSDENHLGLWVPAGFAHGFKVLSDKALVSYKCVGKYEKGFDTGIIWNDKDLNIEWGVREPIISEKDSKLPSFKYFLENVHF